MRALISKIGDKIYFRRKMRQLRKESVKARRDLEFWMACDPSSGDRKSVVSIIEQNRTSTLS